MALFTTSKDLLNLALAIGIIGISAAIVYFFVSAAGFIRELRQTIDEINRQLNKVNQITEAVKNKITYMFSYWAVLERLARKVIGLAQKNLVNKIKNKVNRKTTTEENEVAPKQTTKKASKDKAKSRTTRSSKK